MLRCMRLKAAKAERARRNRDRAARLDQARRDWLMREYVNCGDDYAKARRIAYLLWSGSVWSD